MELLVQHNLKSRSRLFTKFGRYQHVIGIHCSVAPQFWNTVTALFHISISCYLIWIMQMKKDCRILHRLDILTLPSFTYADLFLFNVKSPFNTKKIVQWAVKAIEKSY